VPSSHCSIYVNFASSPSACVQKSSEGLPPCLLTPAEAKTLSQAQQAGKLAAAATRTLDTAYPQRPLARCASTNNPGSGGGVSVVETTSQSALLPRTTYTATPAYNAPCKRSSPIAASAIGPQLFTIELLQVLASTAEKYNGIVGRRSSGDGMQQQRLNSPRCSASNIRSKGSATYVLSNNNRASASANIHINSIQPSTGSLFSFGSGSGSNSPLSHQQQQQAAIDCCPYNLVRVCRAALQAQNYLASGVSGSSLTVLAKSWPEASQQLKQQQLRRGNTIC
jgi:hypothetical protein